MSTFYLTPGNAVSCYINTHRSGWDGVICAQPDTWNCAATAEFRRDYCARGTDRCYHIHTFDAPSPYFVMDDYGAGWILGNNIHTLDDQLLLILAREGSEPRGIREEYRRRYKVAGAYRIKEVRKIEQAHRTLWEIHPHEDGWTRFHQFLVDSPRFEHAGGPYVKQIDRELVMRVFAEAAEVAGRPDPGWHDPEDCARFEQFHQQLPDWLESAARASARLPQRDSWRSMAAKTVRTVGEQGQGPLAELPSLLEQKFVPGGLEVANEDVSVAGVQDTEAVDAGGLIREAEAARSVTELRALDGDPLCERPPLLEDSRREWVQQTYGDAAFQAIQVASLTKEILILRGMPGVGKSHLALRLLDDEQRERTLVVPVAATWRGREDLLGYVNPVTQEFEPTRFTEFLLEAEAAWQSDDQRAWAVVFEEFTLSQPEHWLSDVLVASQHGTGPDRDRILHLGGTKIRGREDERNYVELSPAIRFVATVSSDHTVRPLSSRILDRAAVVDLRREPRQSLSQAGLRVLEDMTMAIADLDFLVRIKGAGFSLRAALSLRKCLEELDHLEMGEWDVVDLVLVQEVLSKIRLLARDPLDEAMLQDLKKWQNRHGSQLTRCSSLISEWEDLLRSGVDVVQV
ncbi:MAG: hypothetical protein VX951_10690 [Planctomycetota bacterium]|nr:hypothetical protein [Planctomycetota bacterium]